MIVFSLIIVPTVLLLSCFSSAEISFSVSIDALVYFIVFP